MNASLRNSVASLRTSLDLSILGLVLVVLILSLQLGVQAT
jgi:hypothetical protein